MINIQNVDFILWNTEVHGQKKKLIDSIGTKNWVNHVAFRNRNQRLKKVSHIVWEQMK